MQKKIYNVPFKGYKTHVAVYGELDKKKTPLIILHGGPGGTMYSYEPLFSMCSLFPIIAYDQLGSGYSKVPKGSYDLYTYNTYIEELDNLMDYFAYDKYNVLGHSWGGMLALLYISNKGTSRINKLILFSTLPSTKLWNSEHLEMISSYPEHLKKALISSIESQDYSSKYYKEALKMFYNDHVGKGKRKDYFNYERKRFPKTNKEIYEYMWGKSELFGDGTLKDYDVTDKLHLIDVPTLILNGRYDESSYKQNELLFKGIKDSKWSILENSHHRGYLEERELAIKLIKGFLYT